MRIVSLQGAAGSTAQSPSPRRCCVLAISRARRASAKSDPWPVLLARSSAGPGESLAPSGPVSP